jgi:hypothetical protein
VEASQRAISAWGAESVVLAHGDEGATGDEGSELAGRGLFGRPRRGPRVVGREEQVIVVAVELGALVFVHGVLNGQRVQPEPLGEHRVGTQVA